MVHTGTIDGHSDVFKLSHDISISVSTHIDAITTIIMISHCVEVYSCGFAPVSRHFVD